MRALILILFLPLSLWMSAQNEDPVYLPPMLDTIYVPSLSSLSSIGVYQVGKVYGESPSYVWDNEFIEYEASLATELSADMKTALNDLMTNIKDSLVIDSLNQFADVFYILGNETKEAALTNLIKRAHDGDTATTGAVYPAFTQYEGYAGDGVGAYINANYNPFSQGIVYTQNSASIGVYCVNDFAGTNGALGTDFGGSDRSYLIPRNTSNQITGGLNSAGLVFGAYSATTSVGLTILSRTASDSVAMYKNGIRIPLVAASAAVSNAPLYILRVVTSYTARQVSAVWYGRGLTKLEMGKLTNCLNAFFTKVNLLADVNYIRSDSELTADSYIKF